MHIQNILFLCCKTKMEIIIYMSKFFFKKRTKADPKFKTHAIDNLKTSTIDEQLMLNIEAKYVILFEGSIPHILI